MLLCFTISDYANIATIGGFLVAFFGAWYAVIQLKHIKEANYATGFAKACDILQAEDARNERGFVFETLGKKKFEEWTNEEKKKGELVCHKFDTLGAMVANKLITKGMALHWKYTLSQTWDILKPLVYEYRTKRGNNYWDDYESIAEEAKK